LTVKKRVAKYVAKKVARKIIAGKRKRKINRKHK
jgi:hypothetical protein